MCRKVTLARSARHRSPVSVIPHPELLPYIVSSPALFCKCFFKKSKKQAPVQDACLLCVIHVP